MIDKYISRLKIIGEHEIADYLQTLQEKYDAAIEDMTELMQLSKFCCYCKNLIADGECIKDFDGMDTKNLGRPGGWWCWEWRGTTDGKQTERHTTI